MKHFGIFCFPSPGHLYPMSCLGYELKKRGYRVSLIGFLDEKDITIEAGLEFYPIAEKEFPAGLITKYLTELGKISGLKALKYTLTFIAKIEELRLKYASTIIKEIGIDALLVDQAAFAGGTIAELLGIPFITVSNALILNQDLSFPPHCFFWDYNSSWWGKLRNLFGYSILALIGLPIKKVLDEYRKIWNLPKYSTFKQSYSRLAQISQQPAEFDFPRADLPLNFYFSGPFHSPVSRKQVPFPWHELTKKPLIYASMGTLQNQLIWIFETIASACENLDVQLVISLGSHKDGKALENLPGNPLVVNYAPQLELLKQANLCITHAGMNTTLESLSNGIPMVAIPITNDQPGVAARIKWTGTGEVILLQKLNKQRLKIAIKKVLTQPSYHKNAKRLKTAIQKSGGVDGAADLIETILNTSDPNLKKNNL